MHEWWFRVCSLVMLMIVVIQADKNVRNFLANHGCNHVGERQTSLWLDNFVIHANEKSSPTSCKLHSHDLTMTRSNCAMYCVNEFCKQKKKNTRTSFSICSCKIFRAKHFLRNRLKVEERKNDEMNCVTFNKAFRTLCAFTFMYLCNYVVLLEKRLRSIRRRSNCWRRRYLATKNKTAFSR